jgi:hypothetical protein
MMEAVWMMMRTPCLPVPCYARKQSQAVFTGQVLVVQMVKPAECVHQLVGWQLCSERHQQLHDIGAREIAFSGAPEKWRIQQGR